MTKGQAAPSRLRVVIAEDSVLLLAGLTKLLDGAGFDVVVTAGDATELLAAVEREQPDIVIADARMPPTHTDEGIRAALAIRGQWPDIAILVLSWSPSSWCAGAGTRWTRSPSGNATCLR